MKPKVWHAIFPDYRDLSSGVLQDKPWGGGSNMTSDFQVVDYTSYQELERKLAKAKEALKHYSNEEDNETYLDVFDCIKVKGSCTEFDDVKFGKVARETLAEIEGASE